MIGPAGCSERAAARRRADRALRSGVVTLLLGMLALSGACRGQPARPADVTVDVQVTPAPAAVGPGQVTVRLADGAGQPIDGATVSIMADMTHAGMAPVRADAVPAGVGRYVTRDFAFTMAGDWAIAVEAALPTGQTATRSVTVTVGPGDGRRTPPGESGERTPDGPPSRAPSTAGERR